MPEGEFVGRVALPMPTAPSRWAGSGGGAGPGGGGDPMGGAAPGEGQEALGGAGAGAPLGWVVEGS